MQTPSCADAEERLLPRAKRRGDLVFSADALSSHETELTGAYRRLAYGSK